MEGGRVGKGKYRAPRWYQNTGAGLGSSAGGLGGELL